MGLQVDTPRKQQDSKDNQKSMTLARKILERRRLKTTKEASDE